MDAASGEQRLHRRGDPPRTQKRGDVIGKGKMVAAQDLVGSLSVEHDLDAGGLGRREDDHCARIDVEAKGSSWCQVIRSASAKTSSGWDRRNAARRRWRRPPPP